MIASRTASLLKRIVKKDYYAATHQLLTGFYVDRQYRKALTIERERQRNGRKVAVAIHLFYTDNWPLFRKMLGNIPSNNFRLFVTIPKSNVDFIPIIYKDFSDARIFVVPNRGRDVLPFLRVAKLLIAEGYDSVMKFHSKKSTHRNDGQQWLEDMLDKLIPENSLVIQEILTAISLKSTAIIGPTGVYYPLTINFPANGSHMTRIIRRLYGRQKAYDILQKHRSDYGFFGGTMFWARLDAIEPLLNFSARKFEVEAGQIDGTLAHALERLLCVVPEINDREIYEVSNKSLHPRVYYSDNIPEWSTDHDK